MTNRLKSLIKSITISIYGLAITLALGLLPGVSLAGDLAPGTSESRYFDEAVYNHPHFSSLLSNGNLLMCKVGYRAPAVVEVTPGGDRVWSFDGVQAASALRLANGNTLIADTGAPGSPRAPRVIEVSGAGAVVWEYPLSSPAQAPRFAQRLASGNTLITLPFQVIEVSPDKKTVWSYGWGKPVSPETRGYLARPVQAVRLAGGNTLIVDRGLTGGKVFELTPAKDIVWEYGDWNYKGETGQLSRPLGVMPMQNGNTVIADAGTYSLLEISPKGQLVGKMSWREAITGKGVMNQWHAAPLGDGRMLLTVSYTNSMSRVMEIQTLEQALPSAGTTTTEAPPAQPGSGTDNGAGDEIPAEPGKDMLIPNLQ